MQNIVISTCHQCKKILIYFTFLFTVLSVQNLVCTLHLQLISVQTSHTASAQELPVASGYYTAHRSPRMATHHMQIGAWKERGEIIWGFECRGNGSFTNTGKIRRCIWLWKESGEREREDEQVMILSFWLKDASQTAVGTYGAGKCKGKVKR